jgi:hypothetical protein
VLALGGLACGRTELMLATDTELGPESSTVSATVTAGLDTGSFDTGRPDGGFDSGSITVTFTSGFDSGVFDTGFDEVTGFPGTSITSGVTTEIDETGFPGTTATTTTTNGTDTGVGTTDGGTTEPGTTSAGTTDGGTTDGGTTDGGTTDGGTTGGDPTCQDAVDCVIACGGASPGCIGQCNDGLTPEDDDAFTDFETCIIFACFGNGSCDFGGFDEPACVACRVDGQTDPAPLGCDDEAALCT